MENFEKKINELLNIYKETKIKDFVYFVDYSLAKNKHFYSEEINKIEKAYNVNCNLCYGEQFWTIINHKEIWNEIINYLIKWKQEIPAMPSINFDENYVESFNEIKNMPITIFRKLFDNKEICKEILPILFPENKVLKLLIKHFEECEESKSIYINISKKIREYI